MPAKRITFEGTCQRCEGSGLWQQRAGYTCNACGGSGRVTVAAKPFYRKAELIEKFGQGYGFYVVSAKGNVTKQRYEAGAELAREVRRYRVGMTVGSGWYEHYERTNAVGAACGVLGVLADGELHVALPGGGFGRTGERGTWADGGSRTIEVRVTEEAAAAVIEELRAMQPAREEATA